MSYSSYFIPRLLLRRLRIEVPYASRQITHWPGSGNWNSTVNLIPTIRLFTDLANGCFVPSRLVVSVDIISFTFRLSIIEVVLYTGAVSPTL